MKNKPNWRRRLLMCLGWMFITLGGLGLLTWHQVRQERLNRALMAAVKRNDTLAARKLLREGADGNARYEIDLITRVDYWLDDYYLGEPLDTTALVIAAAEGNTDIVRLLIQHGADVNVRCRYDGPNLDVPDPTKYTALEMARGGHSTEIVRLLQQAGAK